MRFLASLFGRSSKEPARFVSEPEFVQNLAKQKQMTPQTLAQLREHGVTESSSRRIEFFFYTNTDGKAQGLAASLCGLGYQAGGAAAATDKRLRVVTGWTTPMKVSDSVMVAWTDQMCRLGYDHDAEFDGWGTNVDE